MPKTRPRRIPVTPGGCDDRGLWGIAYLPTSSIVEFARRPRNIWKHRLTRANSHAKRVHSATLSQNAHNDPPHLSTVKLSFSTKGSRGIPVATCSENRQPARRSGGGHERIHRICGIRRINYRIDRIGTGARVVRAERTVSPDARPGARAHRRPHTS